MNYLKKYLDRRRGVIAIAPILLMVLITGCATRQVEVKNPVVSETNVVTPVVRVISEVYAETGGAAKYEPEQQYMLALRPPIEGVYVKLEPSVKNKQGTISEFKVPPPTKSVSETVSKSVVVFFTFNNSKLGVESKNILKKIASSGLSISSVTVQGFADSKGNQESNLKLSKERADAVVKALIEAGIPSQKISSDGFGSKSPIDDNDSMGGRSRNRRVEINVIGEEIAVE